MLPDNIENRHGPPGFNSRSMTTGHTDDDLEVLKEIDHVYFANPADFDATRYILEHAPPATCDDIDIMFNKLKKQQQVVSAKALYLIQQQRDNCDREFAEIQNIKDYLVTTIQTCREARKHLRTASDNLTVSTFVILANYRKRQVIKTVLKSLELLKKLRSTEKEVSELLNRKEYEEAIVLILKGLKDAAAHKEFTCISDLASRLQDTLEITEEKLDTVLAAICYNFDEITFVKLRKAFNQLGKIQSAMEQLHMHYTSAINETSMVAVRDFVNPEMNCIENKFQDLCQAVPTSKAPLCLLNLCENLFLIMKSYYLLVNWHLKNDDEPINSDNVFEIEKSVSREYIREKLKSGLLRIWYDVQNKVSMFLKCSGLEEYPFEKFIQMLGILKKLTQIAEVFCGDKSDVLQDLIKTNSVTYIKNYHKGRMDELKLFLENEGWEQCPVKTNFTILNLQEFKQFKKYINPHIKSDISILKAQSDSASSANSQDESVYISKYLNTRTTRTPFEIFRDENITNDDIFGLEQDSFSDDSDDEPEELKRDYVDETDYTESLNNLNQPTSPSKAKDIVIVTNTTLSLLRNCGQYLQICRYLPQISLEVIMLMNQLFDYYLFTVHYIFTADLKVASTTLYTNKLTATLKRISNNIENSNDENKIMCPELPSHLNITSEDGLHGLRERIVAVESLVFLSKQFEILQPYLENIVAQHQKMILEHFKDNTLAVVPDLRRPIYMCSASKAFDAKSALIAISSVKWDMKDLAEHHSSYVDLILRHIQIFTMRLENISIKVTINLEILHSIWAMVSKFIVHLLVEGYSNATKCSNGGRGLMQLDYRQLFMKLEKICGVKPIPYQDYVDRYVKAYYLPRNELENFVRERNDYSNKHLLALVTCSCENKRDRQELSAIIEGVDNK